jgi:hypothetical protein
MTQQIGEFWNIIPLKVQGIDTPSGEFCPPGIDRGFVAPLALRQNDEDLCLRAYLVVEKVMYFHETCPVRSIGLNKDCLEVDVCDNANNPVRHRYAANTVTAPHTTLITASFCREKKLPKI